MKVKIRLAEVDDLEEVFALCQELEAFLRPFNPLEARALRKQIKNPVTIWKKYVKKCIQHPDYAIFLAEDKNKIIGFSLLGRSDWPPIYQIQALGEVKELYVLPEYRRKGIAFKLLKQAQKFFKKKGWQHMWLAALHQNKASKNVYERFGFHSFRDVLIKKIK